MEETIVMITKEQYEEALKRSDAADKTISAYYKQEREAFAQRLKDNPIFTDDELFYSRTSLCPCGHGLAYPKNCGPGHYWDCSAILKGIADKSVSHIDRLPFAYYEVKGEREGQTTRGVFLPKRSD